VVCDIKIASREAFSLLPLREQFAYEYLSNCCLNRAFILSGYYLFAVYVVVKCHGIATEFGDIRWIFGEDFRPKIFLPKKISFPPKVFIYYNISL
jgi:hypothetical protein